MKEHGTGWAAYEAFFSGSSGAGKAPPGPAGSAPQGLPWTPGDLASLGRSIQADQAALVTALRAWVAQNERVITPARPRPARVGKGRCYRAATGHAWADGCCVVCSAARCPAVNRRLVGGPPTQCAVAQDRCTHHKGGA